MPIDQLDAFMWAIGSQESGHNPEAENRRTGAHGTWQIMPSNWSAWAAEAGLGANAVRSAENQERVARAKMEDYYRQFGSWDAVAVAWFAGPGRARAYLRGDRSVLDLSDGNLTVGQYVSKMRRGMEGWLGGPGGDALSRQAANRAPAVRREAEQQAGMQPGTLSAGDPFQARTDPRAAMTAMLQAVSDRTAGRTGAVYGQRVAATDAELDDGSGFTNLRGARRGDQAIETVNAILASYRTAEPAAAGSAGPPAGAATRPADPDRGIALVEAAKKFLGVDYVWGGVSATGMDCSGLMILAARQLGVDLPRLSRDQARSGVEVEGGVAEARPGDLITFDAGKERGVVNHIGMVVGRDEKGRLLMIHAPRTGRQVEVVAVTRRDVMNVRRIV